MWDNAVAFVLQHGLHTPPFHSLDHLAGFIFLLDGKWSPQDAPELLLNPLMHPCPCRKPNRADN